MLWYKGWLETRFRLLFVLGFGAFFVFLATHTGNSALTPGQRLVNGLSTYWWAAAVMLAGAGIKTQAAFQATKGLHGSVYFTLSLPVSRLRLLATRAGLGMLETVAVIAGAVSTVWLVFPGLRAGLAVWDALEYVLVAAICVSACYSLSALLATFLDDMWQFWGSFIAIFFLRWLSEAFRVPPSLNVFRAMGLSSTLFTHTLPWACMGISLGAAAILFFAAVKVVQLREY